MFALEIAFQDGVSQPEMILVRRPQFLVGASDYAHVVVEDMADSGLQLRVVRELGRRFRTKVIRSGDSRVVDENLEGVFDTSAHFDLGRVRLWVNALDTDLAVREGEPPDRAGARILRQAASAVSPVFPAVLVRGGVSMVVSFAADQPVYIGRSKQCAVRLDSADISARHARMGFEQGHFWIEDLGSTNGTFVNGQQISGRINLEPGTPVVLGREATVLGVLSERDLSAGAANQSEVLRGPLPEKRFPALVSLSETARPARLALVPGASMVIGRDPSSDLWLGAPHVSRRHCVVRLADSGRVIVADHSTNGTGYSDGILRSGEELEVWETPQILDFGGGVTVGICFSEEQEREFAESEGSGSSALTEQNTLPERLAARGTRVLGAIPAAPGAVTGIYGELRRRFLRASLLGRLVMLSIGIAAVAVVFVILNLLWPVFL